MLGVLAGLPYVAGLLEPPLMLLADGRWRGRVAFGGGLGFALGLLLLAAAPSAATLCAASLLLGVASGAFVSVTQLALAETAAAEREQALTRWTIFGTFGVLAGPLLV